MIFVISSSKNTFLNRQDADTLRRDKRQTKSNLLSIPCVFVSLRFILLHFSLIVIIATTSCHSGKQDENKSLAKTIADTTAVGKQIFQLSQSIVESPKNAALYHERAKLYIGQKKFSAAFEDMKTALSIDSTKILFLLTMADLYFVTNQTRETKNLLEKCVTLDNSHVEANLKLAELYLYVQDHQQSINHLDNVLKTDMHNARAYFMKGINFREMNDTTKAISSFQTAIEQKPEYYEAFMQLGIIYSEKKNKMALQYFNSALGLKPSSIEAYYGRALCLQENNEPDKAIQDYNTILKINPQYKLAHYNLGYVHLVYLKKYEDAIKCFSDAISYDPNYVEAYYNRGLSYELSKNKKKAKEDYEKAVQLKPDYEAAVAGMRRVR